MMVDERVTFGSLDLLAAQALARNGPASRMNHEEYLGYSPGSARDIKHSKALRDDFG